MKKNKVEVSNRFRKRKVDNSNLIKKSQREYQKITFLAIVLFAVFCGTSYALFSNVVKSTKTIEVTSGIFKVEFKESNSIKLNNAAPVTDEVGMNNTPYTFTIDNTGTLPAKYNISLEENLTNNLDRKYIKYSIKEDNGEWSTPLTLENSLILTANRLLSSGEKTNYELKLWLDENADNSVQGKNYQAKIVINSVQTNANLSDVTSPIIQLNGNSTINIEQGKTFTDPGISSVKDDEDDISISDITKRYEYFDGDNIYQVDNIDTTKIGTYYIYYEVKDTKNNLGTTIRIINIYKKDSSIPTISLIGDEIVKLNYDDKYEELGAVAQDEKDGSLTDKIVIVGTVNTKKEGTYVIKYLIENSLGTTSSVTRTIIVLPKSGTITAETAQDDSDNTKTVVDIAPTTNADTVKYAITTENKKPADKEFKTMEELEQAGKAENGKIILTKNDTYYIWIKDSNGNIIKKEVVVTTIDETTPICKFSKIDYIGVGETREIELTCTDIADIKEKKLTPEMFNIENIDNAEIISISTPEKITNGYKYKISIKAKKTDHFNIILPKNTIYDGADNTNEKTISESIKTSIVNVKNSNIDLDVNKKNTDSISADGVNIGTITYKTSNSSIATVTNDGQVKAISPGIAYITVQESNGGAKAIVTVNVEKTLSATFEKYGTGTNTISSTIQSCKLTKDNPTTCHVTGPDINTKEGYTPLGWNTDKNAHIGAYDLELSDNTTYYSITKKDSITLVAAFSGNGSTLSPNEGTQTCTLNEVFNNEQQETSCHVTLPEIIANENTPVVVGFVENNPAITKDSIVLTPGDEIELTEKNTTHTWYAITKSNPITYKVTYNKNTTNISEISKEEDSCTISETYNGIKQADSCTVVTPSITTKKGYTAIGWSENNTAYTGISQNHSLQLTGNTTYYAISSKDAITYTATFAKSGPGIDKISSTTTSCTISSTYNEEKQATTCDITLPNISVKEGYTAIGWSDSQISHEGEKQGNVISISNNDTYYSISKKNAIELTAKFNGNGANLTSKDNKNCTLEEVYNNEAQATSCVITPPSVERENFTILGYDNNENQTDPSIKLNENITLTPNNNNNTWYAITKKDVNIVWTSNGSTLSSTQSSCTIWNSATTCSVSSPSITRDDYQIIGFNTDNSADTSTWNQNTLKNVDSSEKYYAITTKKLTATFNKNNSISQTDENNNVSSEENVTRSCIIKNLETKCTVTSPKIEANPNTPIVIGYNENSDNETSTWNELTEQSISKNQTYYAITTKNSITYTATFTKNGVGVEKISSEKEVCTIPATYNGAEQEKTCEITTPSIQTKNGYSKVGWNTNNTAHDGIETDKKIKLDNNYEYYSISKKDAITLTGTFVKSGIGVDKISSTSSSCVLEATYNDEIQKTTCNIETPQITVTGLYYALGWSQNQTATELASSTYAEDGYVEGNLLTLNKSNTFYSISKKDELVLTANFDENGTTMDNTSTKLCTLEEVYNNQVRDDSCTFTIPTINRDNFDIIGLNQDKDSHTNDNSYKNETKQLTIDSNNNNKTWYVISKRDLTINYNKNGATSISKDKDSCTIWNSNTTCQVTTPTIERETFEILGWNSNKDTIDETNNISINKKIDLNDNITYYAITRKIVTTSFHLNGSSGQTNSNGKIVADENVQRICSINNVSTDCSITSPAIVASYNTPQIIGYSLREDGISSDLNEVESKKVSENKDYYAITKKDEVTYSVTYNKQGVGVTSISKTQDSCTIPATYNGIKQDSYCQLNTLPTTASDDGFEVLGWSQNKDATTETDDVSATSGYIKTTGKIAINKNVNLYVISKKNAITLSAKFYKNGAESQTYSLNGVITTTQDEILNLSCELAEAYNNNVQNTTCNITSPIINASSNTPSVIGYAVDNDALLSNLKPNTVLTLTSNVNYYAITKKDAITLDASWGANNATLSSNNTAKCTLNATYNGMAQSKTCNIKAPDVTAPKNTPKFLGFSSNHNNTENDNAYNLSTKELTLNEENTGRTWYPITTKEKVDYSVNYKVGAHVTSISKSTGKCVINPTYNGEKQSEICIIGENDTENNPVITPNTGYTSLGWSQLNGTTVGSPIVVLTQNNMTFYANASANNYNINYYSDNALIGSNKVTYDKSFSLSTIADLNLQKRGYTFKNWISNGKEYNNGASINTNLASEENANVRFDAIWEDEEKPVCRFVSVGSTTTQNTATARVECTDNGSGIALKNLAISDFKISDSKYGQLVSVSSPQQITDGYYYDVVVKGLSVGSFNVSINADAIHDNAGNTSLNAITPTPINVSGRKYTINYTKGNNVVAIGSTSGSCTTEGTSITCYITLPSITSSTGYTTSGWYDGTKTNEVGSTYELNETLNNKTLIATSADITAPTCSISGNPTNWTQSAVLTVSGSDNGSGLSATPYSWESNSSGFSTTSTKTINGNATYTAYVKDASGNVGSCSTTTTKIDTTAPKCSFSESSDTSIVAGNNTTIEVSCSDNQSGITGDSNLSTADFQLSSNNASIKSVESLSQTEFKYKVTITGKSYGNFNLSLNASALEDNAHNKNKSITSSNMTAYNLASVGVCNNLTYNGKQQDLAGGGTGITFSENSKTTAGKYDVIMTPQTGYMFSDEASTKTRSCEIKPKTTTCTATSTTKTYDGSELTSSSGSCTDIISGQTTTFNNTGKITNAGTINNTINSVTIKSENIDVTGNYDITKVNGKLTVNKQKITCTATTTSRVYDGKELTASTGNCTNIVSGQTTTFNNTGSITNVGTENNILNSVTIKSGNNDVTGNYDITKVNGKLTVTLRPTTCTATTTSKDYDGKELTSSSGSCTDIVSGQTTTFNNTGSITNTGDTINTLNSVTIKSGNNDVTGNYNITKVNGKLTINKAASVNPVLTGYNGSYDGASHTIKVTGGSGGTTKYSTDNSNWSTTLPTITNVNESPMTVYVKVFGDSNHSDTSSISADITIKKADSTINLVTGGAYSGAAIHASATGKGTISYNYYSNDTCTTKINTPIDAGTYYVKVTSTGDDNYAGATTACTSHVISKAASTNPSLTGYNSQYDGASHTIGVSGGSGGTKKYSTDNSNWSTTLPTITNVNESPMTVYVKVFGDSNHNDTSSISETVTITKANSVNPTLTGYNDKYDGASHTIGVSGGSGGTIKYSTDNSNWNTTLPTITNVNEGPLTVYAKVFGDSNHNDTTTTSASIKITKADSTISITEKTVTYNGSAVSASASGLGSISYKYYSNALCTSEVSTPIDAGKYYVKATSTGDNNHNGATTNCVSHTINKKSVSVNWGTTTTFTFNGSGQAPTASANSGVSGETLNVSRTTEIGTGTYTSTASLSSVSGGRGNTANYSLTGTTKAYTINGITRAVTFDANGNTISKTSDSCTTSGTSSECNITTPTITAPANTPNVCGFTTSSTGAVSCEWKSNSTASASSSGTYYAQTYSSSLYRRTQLQSGTGVSEIGGYTSSCTINSSFNGTARATTCFITLPSITASKGYENPMWYLSSDGLNLEHFSPGDSAPLAYNASFIYTASASGIVPTLGISSVSGSVTSSSTMDGMTLGGCSASSSAHGTNTWTIKATNITSRLKSGLTNSNAGTATIKIGSTTIGTVTMTAVSPYDNLIVTYDFSCSNAAFKKTTGHVYISIPAGLLISTDASTGNAATTIDTGIIKSATAS